MFKQIFLPLLATMVIIVVLGLFSQGKVKLPNTPIQSGKAIKIENTQIQVEVAKTAPEKQKGLGGRKTLPENSGMIFVFNKEKPTFWMKDTLIPLDLIWISGGKVVGINKNVATELGKTDTELARYPAPQIIDFVLEVNAGFSDKNKITVGQSLSGLEQL